MKTQSIWEGTEPHATQYKTFSGDAEADVVIIGGGITGLVTAYLLGNAGKKVTLLEARSIGLGTTGNSTGNLYATVDEHLHHIQKKWGAEKTKAVVSSRKAAIDFLEKTISELNMDCNFYRTRFSHFSETDDKEVESFLTKEAAAMHDCGLDPRTETISALPFPVKKTLSIGNQAQLHPLRFVRQLASHVSSRCSLHENSQVIDYDIEAGTVKTEQGVIRAKHIVMATHTPVGLFALHTVLAPYREFGIAAELLDQNIPEGIFWSADSPKHSVRVYTEKGKKYVMVIGDKFKTGQHEDADAYVKELELYLKTRFETGDITHIWGGQQYKPADGLPYIGHHNGQLYLATGFSSDGLVYGTLGAMMMADHILGKTTPWDDLYKVTRHTPLKSSEKFVKENLNVAAQYIKDLLPNSADAKTLSEIGAGEGKVVVLNGEKMAVYKDAAHKCHAVSALCTHLKCVVNWNGIEKSWDCPCHGSRFGPDGKVIEGPAIYPLPNTSIRENKT